MFCCLKKKLLKTKGNQKNVKTPKENQISYIKTKYKSNEIKNNNYKIQMNKTKIK